MIEQAIFTSARTARGDGYQLVARSPGISEDAAGELAAWGPSHGALSTERDEATSINFHQLTSGEFCASKTVAAGQEYSGRGGARIYTHFLLVPADVLARFANSPFAVLRAAWAKGELAVLDHPKGTLHTFSLAGRSAPVDEGLLAQLADQWGPARIARLVAAAMTPDTKLLAGAHHNETLIGGLLNCFPVECRIAISFTTGLLHSPRRPFRLVPLEGDAAEQRRAARQEGASVVDISNATAQSLSSVHKESRIADWATYVAHVIASDQLSILVSQLQRARPGLAIEQLNALAVELAREPCLAPVAAVVRTTGAAPKIRSPQTDVTSISRDSIEPAHTASPFGPKVTIAAGTPPHSHIVADQAAVELLEQLDDAVYDTINGEPEILDAVGKLWEALSRQLNPAALAATREQYLRYTLSLWDASQDEGLREPARASRALDVLTVLFETE